MRPYRIAHISDLHISAVHHRKNLRRAKTLLMYARQAGVDHIVVTGDIAADADKKDFELARHLFRSLGLLDSSKMSMVIGNHDIFGGVHIAEDVLDFPKRCKHTDYREKVEQFRHSFREAFEKCIGAHSHRLFPFAKMLGDLMIIGINSVARYSKLRNPVGSNGEVEDSEFDALESMLASTLFKDKRKIVLIHHHFSRREVRKDGTMHSVWAAIEKQTIKLRGKKRLIKLFKEHNIEMVLHGHVHEIHEYERGGIRFLNAGGSVLAENPEQLMLNVLTIGEGAMTTETITLPSVRAAERSASVSQGAINKQSAQAA